MSPTHKIPFERYSSSSFKAVANCYELLVFLLEAVRNIFQKDQAQNHTFIFRCIQVAAQNAGGVPNCFSNPLSAVFFSAM